LPDDRTIVVRQLLDTGPLRHGAWVWADDEALPGPVWLRVDLARQIVSVFRGGAEIGTSVILYGADGSPTPTGWFHVLERQRTHRSNRYEADMPFMLRLTFDGIAIHGTDVLRGYASRGCIGVPTPFAARLFPVANRGIPVLILPEA
jgi:lipoprotein-anchoring transpeptidase ErfK/SrfK